MRGNYKVRVRVPIFTTAEIDYMVFGAESEAAAIDQAKQMIETADIGRWVEYQWHPHYELTSLAEVIEFEATETDTPKEGTNEQDY